MALIRQHDFHSKWRGAPIGIIESNDFFKLSNNEISTNLTKYLWVEFRVPSIFRSNQSVPKSLGFFLADTQLKLSLNLRTLESPGASDIQVISASKSSFVINKDDFLPFHAERFLQIPGVTESDITDRFQLWANMLIDQQPESALRLVMNGKNQGWFFGTRNNKSLDLSVAMLARGATISGKSLYSVALDYFKKNGNHRASGRFSSANFPVLNIFSERGAIFSSPLDIWIWLNPMHFKKSF